MIRIETKNGLPTCVIDVRNRLSVYLDNDAIIELATREPQRRARFIAAIRERGTLMFSLANAQEIGGPKGASAAAVRGFLDAFGCCWTPLDLNLFRVVEREQAGDAASAPISERFIESYFKQRAYDQSPGGSSILDLTADSFFRLSTLIDWAALPLDDGEAAADPAALDTSLRDWIGRARTRYEADPASLNQMFPPIAFDAKLPATFALAHLMRLLVVEAKAFRFVPHDGLDFCHAVLGASSASIATLDKQWKRRIERLPKPNGLARMFYRPELSSMVELVEALIADLKQAGGDR